MSSLATIAAARMPRQARALKVGDRVAVALFLDGTLALEYSRGRIVALSTGGRVMVRFDRFKDDQRLRGECCALDEAMR